MTEGAGDSNISRLSIKLLSRARLQQSAVVHYRHAITKRECLVAVMRHENSSNPQTLLNLAQLVPEALAEGAIEICKRFIEHE